MKERPILFKGEEVRAILAGRKTQTRRIVKPQPDLSVLKPAYRNLDFEFRRMPTLGPTHTPVEWGFLVKYDKPGAVPIFGYKCPYGQRGDRLWVRETWKYFNWTEDGEPFIQYAADDEVCLCLVDSAEWGEKVGDIWAELSLPKNYQIEGRACDQKWRPSIHMPRWASRITLGITNIRVERLQDISERDAQAEGIDLKGFRSLTYGIVGREHRIEFKKLWESINGRGSWDKNPWVWVIEFKRINEARGE